jgi:hypothetical protein
MLSSQKGNDRCVVSTRQVFDPIFNNTITNANVWTFRAAGPRARIENAIWNRAGSPALETMGFHLLLPTMVGFDGYRSHCVAERDLILSRERDSEPNTSRSLGWVLIENARYDAGNEAGPFAQSGLAFCLLLRARAEQAAALRAAAPSRRRSPTVQASRPAASIRPRCSAR